MDSHKFNTFQAVHLMNMGGISFALYSLGPVNSRQLAFKRRRNTERERKLFCESAIKEHEKREKSQVSLGPPWPHLLLIYKGENIGKES